MSNETKQGWCVQCDEEQTFYRPEYEDLQDAEPFRCSMCEAKLIEPTPIEPKPLTAEEADAVPEGVPVADGAPLQDDLDHIRIQLTGPWKDDDLKALAMDLQESSDGAKEGGLGLHFFAVKKTAAQKARDKGIILAPYRDRHGKIMPGVPPLSLSPNRIIRDEGGK